MDGSAAGEVSTIVQTGTTTATTTITITKEVLAPQARDVRKTKGMKQRVQDEPSLWLMVGLLMLGIGQYLWFAHY